MRPLYSYKDTIDNDNFNGSYYWRIEDIIDILMITGDKMLAVGKLRELQREIKRRGN